MITIWKSFLENVKWNDYPCDPSKHYTILYNTVDDDSIRILDDRHVMSTLVEQLIEQKGKNKYRSNKISNIISDHLTEVSNEVGFCDQNHICHIFNLEQEKFTKQLKLSKNFIELHNLPI